MFIIFSLLIGLLSNIFLFCETFDIFYLPPIILSFYVFSEIIKIDIKMEKYKK